MSAASRALEQAGATEHRWIRYLDTGGLILTLLTVIAAVIYHGGVPVEVEMVVEVR